MVVGKCQKEWNGLKGEIGGFGYIQNKYFTNLV